MKNTYTADEMMDILVEVGVDVNFINGAVCVGGHNEQTFERILFYHFGYQNFEGFMADVLDEDDEEDYEDEVDETFYDPYMGCDFHE